MRAMSGAMIFLAKHLHIVLVVCAAAVVTAIAALPIEQENGGVPRFDLREKIPRQLETFTLLSLSVAPAASGLLQAPFRQRAALKN
jgi:hypothetical protein